MKKGVYKKSRTFKGIIAVAVFGMLFNLTGMAMPAPAAAAVSQYKNNSFETAFNGYWGIWKNDASSRTYELYRSYDVPFGHGSYAAAIDATGSPEDGFRAMFLSDQSNYVPVEAGKQYYFSFYAKANQAMNVVFFLENAGDYSLLTEVKGHAVDTTWKKYGAYVTAKNSGNAMVAFAIGGMPDGATLIIDDITLGEYAATLATKELKGYIGDTKKCLQTTGLSQFSIENIEIELPYNDNSIGQATLKKFHPEYVTSNTVCFNFYPQTFSGVGRLYLDNSEIGQFNYNVQAKITQLIPSLPMADEDMTIEGTGFSPIDENTYITLNAMDANGKKYDYYVKPHIIDSALTEVVVRMPIGVVTGKITALVTYQDKDGNIVTNKSNSLSYKVKPVIYNMEWSTRGLDQVGDKITIYGKGIANRPSVNFYQDGTLIAKKTAKLIDINSEEVIEVDTPKNVNLYMVTVTVDGVESDQENALVLAARPKLNNIATGYSRINYPSNDKMQAAKIGDTLTLSGDGLAYAGQSSIVEFEGVNGRIRVNIPAEQTDAKGKSLKVTVPQGTISGYVDVEVNGIKSNYKSLEIIPTIITVNPSAIQPGQPVEITAIGVGTDKDLLTVYFKLNGKSSEEARVPDSLTVASNGVATIRVNAPLSVSSNGSAISLQYHMWRSNQATAVVTGPHINEVAMDRNSHTLVIKGYGFSPTASQNLITYRYADGTVIQPKVKMLGVYNTEDGQEIRVQIMDGYYYGSVIVTVNGQESNQVSFGPMQIRKIARRVEYVKSLNRVMGVLYISGYNFSGEGDVKVGEVWAQTHYRSNNFIIAVVEKEHVYDNPVIVTKQ